MSRHSVAGSERSVLHPQPFAQASVALQVRAKLSIFHGMFAGKVEIDGLFSADNELFMVSAKRQQSEQHLINSFYSPLNILLSMFLQQPKHVREALQSISSVRLVALSAFPCQLPLVPLKLQEGTVYSPPNKHKHPSLKEKVPCSLQHVLLEDLLAGVQRPTRLQ